MKKRILCIILISLFTITLTAQDKKEEVKKPKAIEIKDVIKWKSIRSAVISNNGEWFAYQVAPSEGDGEVIIRKMKEDKENKFPSGDASITYGNISFSYDSKWAAFATSPKFSETKSLKKQKKTIYNGVTVVNLATGEKKEFEKVRSFRFSNENPNWIVLSKYPPEGTTPGKDKPTGGDIVLRELSSGKEFNIGNVAGYSFNKKGDLLAMIIDANDMAGNGILLRNMNTGVIQPIENDKAVYNSLNWTEKGDGLSVLKGIEDKNFEEKVFSVIGFKDFTKETPQKFVFNPKDEKSFPQGMGISTNGGQAGVKILLFLHSELPSRRKKRIQMKRKTSPPRIVKTLL